MLTASADDPRPEANVTEEPIKDQPMQLSVTPLTVPPFVVGYSMSDLKANAVPDRLSTLSQLEAQAVHELDWLNGKLQTLSWARESLSEKKPTIECSKKEEEKKCRNSEAQKPFADNSPETKPTPVLEEEARPVVTRSQLMIPSPSYYSTNMPGRRKQQSDSRSPGRTQPISKSLPTNVTLSLPYVGSRGNTRSTSNARSSKEAGNKSWSQLPGVRAADPRRKSTKYGARETIAALQQKNAQYRARLLALEQRLKERRGVKECHSKMSEVFAWEENKRECRTGGGRGRASTL